MSSTTMRMKLNLMARPVAVPTLRVRRGRSSLISVDEDHGDDEHHRLDQRVDDVDRSRKAVK